MVYDKSLKLLNYAETVNGSNYLRLFTELDHSFKVDDKIFINGGFYDNIQNLSFTTEYKDNDPSTHVYDPFKKTNYYTVLSVDYNNNSFVLDYIVNILTFPYVKKGKPEGTSPNPHTTNVYNSYPNEIHKGVYVSRTIFGSGIFNSGIINNGIFGTDYYSVGLSTNINNIFNVNPENVKIFHIISKNTIITKGVIYSKTANDPVNTRKFKIIEDGPVPALTTTPTTFYPQQIPINPNNDSYGYTIFEGFETLHYGNSTLLTVNNVEFVNNLGKIILNNVIYNNCRIGNNELTTNNKIQYQNKQTISACKVQNTNTISPLSIDHSILDNGYQVTVNGFEIINSTTIKLKIDYNSLANKEMLHNGSYFYISNIINLTGDDYHPFIGEYKLINDTDYSSDYGNIGYEFILELEILNSIDDFTNSDVTHYNFDDIKIHPITDSRTTINNSVLSNYSITNDSNYIQNSEINGGFYKECILYNNTINGINNKIYIKDITQHLYINQDNNDINMSINNAYIKNNLISAKDVKLTKFENVILYQCELDSDIIIDKKSKLSYVKLLSSNNIQISTEIVHYNNVTYFDNISNNSKSTYPEKRISPLYVHLSYTSMGISDHNYNIITVRMGNTQYNSRYNISSITITPIGDVLIPKSKLRYETLNLTKLTNSEIINTYLDFSKTTGYTYTGDQFGYNRRFFGKFVDGAENMNRTNATGFPTTSDSDFSGLPREDITTPYEIYSVPTSYLETIDNYNYRKILQFLPTHTISYATYDFYDQKYMIDNFPDLDNSNIQQIIQIEFGTTYRETVQNGESILNPFTSPIFIDYNFIILNDFLDHTNISATKFPASFIEVEYIEIETIGSSVIITDILNQIPQYGGQGTHFDQYNIDYIIDETQIKRNFKLQKDCLTLNPSNYKTYLLPNHEYNISIAYWITWNYHIENTGQLHYEVNSAGNSTVNSENRWEYSKRTRHEYKFNIHPV